MVRVFLLLLLASAAALAGDLTGVHNFHQVNDRVYRGAQPTGAGFNSLAKLGIATVIDLRLPGEDRKSEEAAVRAAGMRYISVPLKGLGAPSHAEVGRILAILDDPNAGPVFIHCRRGADRTGTIVACYRITHDRWDNRRALAEARSLGMRWFERGMQSYVLQFSPAMIATASESAVAPAQ